MKKGIAVCGNIVVDIIYHVDNYPNIGELSNITREPKRATGGLVCNVAIDLATLDENLPIKVYGMIGDDEFGHFVLDTFSNYQNINTLAIKKDKNTSYTLVISDENTRQRTFFQQRGANSVFNENCIDLENLEADILHIGYILLLDELDKPDKKYGTKLAKLLNDIQKKGIKTSIDLVSENSQRFKEVVIPSLKYSNYCIINEFEAQNVTGILLRNDGILLKENMKTALEKLKDLGVLTWAVIHCPEGSFGLDENNVYHEEESIKLEKGFIKGSVGAGDGFCSGVLYGIYNDMPMKKSLLLGEAVAICVLSGDGATEGIKTYDETVKLYNQLSKESKL